MSGVAQLKMRHQRLERPAFGVDAIPNGVRQRCLRIGGALVAHRLDERQLELLAARVARTEQVTTGDRRNQAAALARAQTAAPVAIGTGRPLRRGCSARCRWSASSSRPEPSTPRRKIASPARASGLGEAASTLRRPARHRGGRNKAGRDLLQNVHRKV